MKMTHLNLHQTTSKFTRRVLAAMLVVLCVCWASFARARTIVHVVGKGQNVSMIAKRYHTSVRAIERHNGLKSRYKLRVGQRLRILEEAEHRRWRKFYEKKNTPRPSKPTESHKRAPKTRKKAARKPRSRQTHRKKGAVAPASKPPLRRRTKTTKRTTRKGGKRRRSASNAKQHSRKDAGERPLYLKYARKPKRPGRVTLVRHKQRFRGQLTNRRGRLIPRAARRVDRLLRSRRTGEKTTIDRRLVKLIARASNHFGGRTLVLVSGYRPYSPGQYTRNSRHNHGKAVDFRIVGVPNRALYEFCRTLRNVGCGYYPNSVFVHMDVRKHKTQWTDYSRPGQKPIYAHRLKRQRAARAAAAKSARKKKKRRKASRVKSTAAKHATTKPTPTIRKAKPTTKKAAPKAARQPIKAADRKPSTTARATPRPSNASKTDG